MIFFPSFLIQYHQTAVVPRASILAAEVEWLKSIKADLVVIAAVFLVMMININHGVLLFCAMYILATANIIFQNFSSDKLIAAF